MKLVENISLEEISGKTYKVRLIESIDYGKASLSHYLHNSTNGISKNYKKSAHLYLKHVLELKYPEIEITNTVAENAMEYLLFNYKKEKIPFPSPENPTFKFIDLFSGIGGFRLASQNLGGNCVFSSEWDEFSQKTYEANFGETPFGDITKAETRKFIPKNYDLLCAGFPCQPFSYAGLKQGFDETRGTLFFDILEILKNTEPKMFLLENVKGLKSHEGGKTLEIIENSLKELGYTIKWEILNSYDFGLPQYRERWYCVGFKEKVDFEFPKGNKRGVKIKAIIDEKANLDKKLKLSEFEIERINFHFSSNDERVKHDNSKYNSNTKKGKHGVYSFQKADGALRFHIGDIAKTQIQEAFYACEETYAPTIIANRVPKLWDLQRKLSVLEAQRLQGFPDNFKFPISDNQAYKQLGNSVAVPVLQAIIKKMLETIK
ncbi:DNA cytosine methyltransferase [Pedobacter nototheniae]|uniref:DNA cytosine methyltransferase n=1 Tax=Pedobacter nototheniae TaxID=2488994 RepID=UPI00293188F5|nr:DNA cytosine methyltransferase [Pedobacter nototheniae]